jgi:hypothetical protein
VSWSFLFPAFVFQLELGAQQVARPVRHAPHPGFDRLLLFALLRCAAITALCGLLSLFALLALLHRLLHALALFCVGARLGLRIDRGRLRRLALSRLV